MKQLKVWSFGLLLLVGFMWLTQSHAAAASWCAVLAPAYNSTDCLAGQNYGTCTVLNGTFDESNPPNSTCGNGQTQAQMKSTLIAKLKNFASSGQYFQQVGANTIENRAYKYNDMTWDQRINQPDVDIRVGYYPFSVNSAYDPNTNSDVTYTDNVSRYSVILSVNGVDYFAIKLDCGNFEGSLQGLPHPTWNLSNSTQIRINNGAWTTADQTVTSVGTAIGFKHDISNAGPDDATGVDWQVEGCYYSSGGTCSWSTSGSGGGAGLPGPATATIPHGTDGGFPVCWPSSPPTACPNTSNYTFSLRGNPKDGDKYCQRISYTHDSGPNNTSYTHSNQVCVTLQLNHRPTGSLVATCSLDNTSATANGTFGDIDATTTTPDKATLTGGAVPITATSTDNGVHPIGPATAGVPAGGGTVTFTLTIPDVGPGAGAPLVITRSVKCGGLPCAGQNTTPQITLPPGTTPAPAGASQGPGGQAGATTTPNQQYYQEVGGKYEIDQAHDQYAGPTTITWNPIGYQASNAFTLDYSNYIKQYPYDDHQTTVIYDQQYTQTYWYTSSSPDYYTCPYGGGLSGSTCSYGAPSYYYCPSGGFPSGSTCYVYAGAATYNASTNTYSCSSGSYVFGACYTSYNASLAYYCNYPAGLSGTTCYYGAQPWYNWHRGSTTFPPGVATTYGGSPALAECYDRNFDVQGPNQTDVTGVTFSPNNESPNSVTIGTNTTVQFTLSDAPTYIGLRHGMGVKGLNYDAVYFVEHASGLVTPLSNSPDHQTLPELGGSVMVSSGTANYPYSVSVPVAGLSVGDEVCAQFTITPEGSKVDENANITVNNGTPVASTQIPNPPTCSAPVQNLPFTRSYGNDVLAGAQLPGGSCNSGSGISANRAGSAGSGSQFAALSLGQISGFASAFLRGVAPVPATGLSFANNTGGDGGLFGGPCTQIPDYFTNDLPAASDPTRSDHPLPSIGVAGVAPLYGIHAYYSNTGGIFNGGTVGDIVRAPQGSSIAVFVDGDVYISNDVIYDQTGWSWDPTTRGTNIPSFYLIVRGNIDIANNVHNLDGVYVAQPNSAGAGGTIRTCSQPPIGGAYPAGSVFSACNSTLTVHGAFIAQNVLMDRAYQSLRYGSSGENPWSGPQNAAEIYDFGPEVYLSSPALNSTGGPTKNKYDYITGLSPVL